MGTRGHDLLELYEKYATKTGISIVEDDMWVLQGLWKHYYPGTANNSVRYPEPGERTYDMPSVFIGMLDALEKRTKPYALDAEKIYVKIYGLGSVKDRVTGIHG